MRRRTILRKKTTKTKRRRIKKKYSRVTIKHGNPLIFAIKNGHTDIAHLLIDYGVELEFNSGYSDPQQPFPLATKQKNISLINSLLNKGCKTHLGGGSLTNAFAYAATHGPDILQLFINAGVDPALSSSELIRTALSAAIQAGNISSVRYLLDHGVDFNRDKEIRQCRLFREAAQHQHREIADHFPIQY